MTTAIIAEGLFKLLLVLLAVPAARLMLLWMDRRIGFNFRGWLHRADDKSKSLYFSARIIAVCLLVGLALS